ncbi:sensor histidine kinase [Niallia sp. NCCP-28]|uniref:sensor histidine kinase n=1 Tax=Niallia sp. NCCP-28 TaxID=2934712 RepID=UPI002089AA24|nr:sensor histidine kinase [Niallia sp. NCCP-28]GKU83536.1 sensor histidine kinase YvfT [Niallia sp. NCCP-28]
MEAKKRIVLFPARFGFFPYMFLVYLILPAFYIAQATGVKRVIGYLLLALFLVSYRQLYMYMDKKIYTFWIGVQMGIIFLLSIFYNPNILFMGFFPANFIGYYKNKRHFYQALAVFAITQIIPLFYYVGNASFGSMIYYLPFFVIMLMSPFGIRSMNKRMDLEKQLDVANEQINQLVKREERMRIARDLHDTLGHTLSLLTLKSQLVGKLAVHKPEQAKLEAKEMEKISRSALKQVRELVSDMRAITIAEELVEVQTILEAADIGFDMDIDKKVSEIPHLTQNILSLCLKEAINNVIKHSGAKCCSVRILLEHGKVEVAISDNGIGISGQRLLGNGLNGMKERLQLVEGELSFTSNHGTLLEITVPIIVKERKEGMAF